MKLLNCLPSPRGSGLAVLTFGLIGVLACQPAPTAAPTAAPAKPTTAPTSAAAASPAAVSASPSPSPAVRAVASPSPSPSPSPGASAALGRVVDFTATDYAYTLPDSLPAGRVTLIMRNAGREVHHAQLLRLNAGVTLEQFRAALQQGEGPALALVSLEGGPGPVGPNETSQVTLDLPEGTYVALCFITSPDGVPHFAKGMLQPLQVTGPRAPASPAPDSQATLTMKDFSYEMPATLPAGRQTYRVVNEGPTQAHELQVVRLQAGKTVDDARQYWMATEPAGPPPYDTLGGMQAMAPGQVGWLTIDLPPGQYVALCVVPDPTSGRRHIDLGMITPFTVR